MRPSFKPHRHQPAPGLRQQQLGTSHRGKTFGDDRSPERLQHEIAVLDPPLSDQERRALNEAVKFMGIGQRPCASDILDKKLGTGRRRGLDSIMSLMHQTGVLEL